MQGETTQARTITVQTHAQEPVTLHHHVLHMMDMHVPMVEDTRARDTDSLVDPEPVQPRTVDLHSSEGVRVQARDLRP